MNKVIIINSSSYPYGYASVQKVKLLSKGLYENNYQTYVINSFSIITKSKYPNLKAVGKAGKSIFIYSSGIQYKIGKLSKTIRYPFVLLKELIIINRIFKNVKTRKIILQYSPFILVFWYFVVSKISRADLYINTMEHHISIKKNINSILFDKYSYFFAKGAIVISHFLEEIVKQSFPKKRTLIIPVTVDHSLFDNNEIDESNKKRPDYLIFVASAGHTRLFEFIIKSFNYLVETNVELILVANGSKTDLENINKCKETQSNIAKRIKIIHDLEYSKLIKLYQDALLLLIPLFDDERDRARFPHKIGEYTASKRPILSTKIGEISYYFKDGYNIFLSDTAHYTTFGEKMLNLVLTDKKHLSKVGLRGNEVGLECFNYATQGKILAEFLNS